MADTVTLTIDAKEITVPRETTILAAAKMAGIEIPTLCYLPKLLPIGSCRLCVVEIDGAEKPVTACTTPAGQDMVVTTQSARLEALRKEAIRFLLINHPLDCPVCDKAGECRLQDLAFHYGINENIYRISAANKLVEDPSPLVERNNQRCVRCGRCVSICNEIQGELALEWVKRGFETEILPRGGYPLQCEFCGQCIAVCPVGALTNRLFKYKARVWDVQTTASVCPYCGGGCAIDLNVRNQKVVRVTSDDETTHNRGNLCGRGNFGFTYISNNNRLHTPLIKRRNEQVPVSWDDALGTAAEHLKKIVTASGPESVAGLGSPRVANEDNYLFQKFLRVSIGTNNIDSSAHFNYRNLQRGLAATIGFPASPSAFDDLEETEVILVVGSDVRAEMPPASLRIMKAARFHGAKVFVANPRATRLDKFSTLSLRYRPGSELLLLAGLMKAVLERSCEHKEFIEKNVSNFEDLKHSLEGMSVPQVSESTGISAEHIAIVAETLGKVRTGCIVFGYDALSHGQGKAVVASLANLALLTGKVGRDRCGLIPAISKNNCQGMLDMGVMPDLLPGYQELEESAAFEKVWGKPVPKKPGKSADEILTGIQQGTIKALYVMGCDPTVDFAEADAWAEALGKLEWLAVQDIFPTDVATRAHYVFPAATFAEKEGTFTSGERRVQRFSPAVEAFRNALPDWKIIQRLSREMGYPMAYAHPGEIMGEIGLLLRYYQGMRYDTMGKNGIQWPLHKGHGSSRVPLKDLNFSFSPIAVKADAPARASGFSLVTGTAFFYSGTLSGFADGLNTLAREAWVEMNSLDANKIGCNEGESVTISAAGKSIRVKVKISSHVPSGVLFVPHNFKDAKVHSLIVRDNHCSVEVAKG